VPAREFADAPEIRRGYRARLHLDDPAAPAAFENAIDLERFRAPVAHALSRVPCVGQASILDPGSETQGIDRSIRKRARIAGRDERVVQDDELGRGRTLARQTRRVLRERRNEERLLEQRQVVGYGLERPGILAVPGSFGGIQSEPVMTHTRQRPGAAKQAF
jgi:hypothetical protein